MLPLKRLSLSRKAAVAPLLGVTLVALLAVLFAWKLNSQRQMLQEVVATEFSTVVRLDTEFHRLTEMHTQLHELLAAASVASDEEQIYIAGKPLLESLHEIANTILVNVSQAPLNAGEREQYRRVAETIGKYQQSAAAAIQMASVDWGLASRHMAEVDGHFARADRDFHSFTRIIKQRAHRKLSNGVDSAERFLFWFIVVGAVALVLMVAAAVLYARSLSSGIAQVVNAITALAAGDRQAAIKGVDGDTELQSISRALEVLRDSLLALDRETNQRRLAESELALAAKVFESAKEGIVISDRANQVLAVNDAFVEISGFTEQEVIGKVPQFLSESGDDYQQVWQELQERGVWRGEIWGRSKCGESRPMWLTSCRVDDAETGDRHFVSLFTDITALKHSQDQVAYLAQRDALTGLPNRSLFIERLEQAIDGARRHNAKLAVLFVDLDHFKDINDTYGHPFGDELLQEIGKRLTVVVRASDTVARIGGDEFVLMLEDIASADSADRVAGKVLEALTQPVILDGKELVVTGSVGVATYPEDGNDSTTLIRNADTAMYQAKSSGRDQFHSYTAEMTASALRKFSLETDLRQAVKRGQLSLDYQPQTALYDDSVTGFEALLRWQHPQRGWVSPALFIPMAEDIGLIEPIGEWVLARACEQARRWRQQGVAGLHIAVNLSARQLANPALANYIESLLRDTGIPADAIEVEVTESSVMERADRCIATLHAIHEHGVPIAVDDFGTGYSSLSYLKRLPLQKVKIDRSFVRDLPHDQDDGALAAAIIAMSHSLGLYVVGEGVETAEQLEFLRDHGCDGAQGFYLGRPMPVLEAEQWLRERASRKRSRCAS